LASSDQGALYRPQLANALLWPGDRLSQNEYCATGANQFWEARVKLLKFVLPFLAATLIAGVAQAADPVKIRVSYVVAPSDWAPLLPEKPDLLKHNGKSYVLEVVRVNGTPALVQAMAANEIEVGNHSYSSLGIAIQNAGMDDLRIISDQFQDGVQGKSTTQYYVLKDGPIQKVEDLKGKVVSSNAAGSAVDVAMRAMLKKHGLEDKRDYTHIEAPLPAQKAMLLDRKTDLISSVVPFQYDPELRDKGRVLFTQRDVFGITQMIVWTARKSFIDKNRAAMVDFMEDALRVVRWYLDPANHDEAVQIASKLTKIPPERFPWLFTAQDYARNGNLTPDMAALQANVNSTRELGFIRAPLDVQKYADLSIVQEAAARLK
jgi:sulfonate transport system substrate-binding protein